MSVVVRTASLVLLQVPVLNAKNLTTNNEVFVMPVDRIAKHAITGQVALSVSPVTSTKTMGQEIAIHAELIVQYVQVQPVVRLAILSTTIMEMELVLLVGRFAILAPLDQISVKLVSQDITSSPMLRMG